VASINVSASLILVVRQFFSSKYSEAVPFDHGQKVKDALNRIKERVNSTPLIFSLLPKQFSLNQLQTVYEVINDVKLDNRNFRKKVKKLPFVMPLNKKEENVSRRPSQLYKFNAKELDSSTITNSLF
jgi:8-oxo-dGTP diphosphatase